METVTQDFLDLMADAAKSGKLHKMLCVLVVAEWSYLSWGDRVKDQRSPEKPFWCNEWIGGCQALSNPLIDIQPASIFQPFAVNHPI